MVKLNTTTLQLFIPIGTIDSETFNYQYIEISPLMTDLGRNHTIALVIYTRDASKLTQKCDDAIVVFQEQCYFNID